MTNPFLCRISVTILAFTLLLFPAQAHTPAEEMADAARNLLASLTPEQRTKTVYEMKHDERLNWDFVPHDRAGLTFKEMTPAQRLLAHALLISGLSQRGYSHAVTIMSLDQVLFEMENSSARRDPEKYYVTLFGNPAAKEPWGWRVEGHHLSLNFTIIEGQVTSSPSFFGSNPGEVRVGPRQGLRVLGVEDDLGREFMQALSEEQKQSATFSKAAPNEIITGKAHKVSMLSPEGLASSKMTSAQQKLLQQLVSEYAHRIRQELAENDLKRIESAGWDNVHFAWAGGLEPGVGHYYRVQGPTFLLEFDNTQDRANHIHTVWRDFKNDFGEDLLRLHYGQAPHLK